MCGGLARSVQIGALPTQRKRTKERTPKRDPRESYSTHTLLHSLFTQSGNSLRSPRAHNRDDDAVRGETERHRDVESD